MNTFKKVVVGTCLSAVALFAAVTPARADSSIGAAVSTMTSKVAALVAGDVAAAMRGALAAPRVYFPRSSPSVVVSAVEAVGTVAMETVTVEASRLPETVVVVEATRLPQEEIVVAATRLPARGTTMVANNSRVGL